MKYCFGDIVVVDGNRIGVIVESYVNPKGLVTYDVYVRKDGTIHSYTESSIMRYMVRHTFLSEEEIKYQHNAFYGVN